MPVIFKDTCLQQDRHPNCFALLCNGECYALSDTDFKDNDCPFAKSIMNVDIKVAKRIRRVNNGIKFGRVV